MCSLNRENIFSNLYVGAGLTPARADAGDHINNNISPTDLCDLKLTRIGEILDNQWNKIPSYSRNVTLDEYVVMPNHIHGIIVIGRDQNNNQNPDRDGATITENIDVPGENSTSGRAPARGAPTITTLGSIIGAFKSRCVNENLRYIEENGLNELAKFWQRNYYERIIRNHNELNEIRNYIRNNPGKLLLDKKYFAE